MPRFVLAAVIIILTSMALTVHAEECVRSSGSGNYRYFGFLENMLLSVPPLKPGIVSFANHGPDHHAIDLQAAALARDGIVPEKIFIQSCGATLSSEEVDACYASKLYPEAIVYGSNANHLSRLTYSRLTCGWAKYDAYLRDGFLTTLAPASIEEAFGKYKNGQYLGSASPDEVFEFGQVIIGQYGIPHVVLKPSREFSTDIAIAAPSRMAFELSRKATWYSVNMREPFIHSLKATAIEDFKNFRAIPSDLVGSGMLFLGGSIAGEGVDRSLGGDGRVGRVVGGSFGFFRGGAGTLKAVKQATKLAAPVVAGDYALEFALHPDDTIVPEPLRTYLNERQEARDERMYASGVYDQYIEDLPWYQRLTMCGAERERYRSRKQEEWAAKYWQR